MEKSSKKKLTHEITQYLQEQIDSNDNPEVHAVWGHKQWKPGEFFQAEDSLRLRPAGHQLLKFFFDHKTFKLDRRPTGAELLTLSRHMNAPYFIIDNKITLYSDEHIVMLKLTGDATSWLKLFR